MSLDVYLRETIPTDVYSANITHNLTKMASAAGLYDALWQPEEIGVTEARALIPILTKGLEVLRADPEKFKAMNPANGWGSYDGLVRFTEEYLAACAASPGAEISVSR